MIKYFKKIAAVVVLSGMSGMAFAQTSCDYELSLYESCGGGPSCDYIITNHPECFPGGAATSNVAITATAFSQASAISRSIGSRLIAQSGGPLASTAPKQKGLSAGSMSAVWNIWANIDQNDTRFGYTTTTGNTAKGSNDILTTVLGADYTWSPSMVIGVSAAFDRGEGWGLSSTPGATANNSITDGYLIAPYLGYQLSKELALDVSAGLGKGKFSGTGGVTAEADRWFAAANLSYARWMGNWQYTGKASFLHGEEDYGNTKTNGVTNNFTASKNKLDQIRLGVQAGYWMNGIMPYAGLGYTSNVGRSATKGVDPLGRDSLVATLGLNFFSLSSKVTGGVFYEEELSRSNSDNSVLSANINFRF